MCAPTSPRVAYANQHTRGLPAHGRDQPSRNGTSPAPRWLDFPHHDQVGSITRTLGLSSGEFYRTTTTVPPHVGLISRMTTRLARLLAHLAGRWRVFPHHDHSPAPRWLVFPHDDQAGSITRTLGWSLASFLAPRPQSRPTLACFPA